MEIICPECGFSRDMPSERLPKHTVIANCPRCGCRFRFLADHGVLGLVSEGMPDINSPATVTTKPQVETPQATEEDDPLPPGAIVPGKESVKVGSSKSENIEGQGVTILPKPDDQAHYIPTDDTNIRIISKAGQERKASESMSEGDSENVEPHTTKNVSGNPWLMAPGKDGWPSAFYQTALRIMLSAPRFFASLVPEMQHNRALLFYLIVCVIETVMDRLWVGVLRSVLEPGMSGDPQLSAMLELLTPETNPFLSSLKNTALLLLQAYLESGLLFLMYRLIAGSRVNFSIVFQVVAYSVAPHVLCIVPVLGVFVGFVWSIGCLVVGLRTALSLNWAQTLLGLMPVVILAAASLQQLLR